MFFFFVHLSPAASYSQTAPGGVPVRAGTYLPVYSSSRFPSFQPPASPITYNRSQEPARCVLITEDGMLQDWAQTYMKNDFFNFDAESIQSLNAFMIVLLLPPISFLFVWLQNSGILVDRVSGDAERFAEKLVAERFAALLAAQQRRKFSKYQLHRWNNAQHSGKFRQNCER